MLIKFQLSKNIHGRVGVRKKVMEKQVKIGIFVVACNEKVLALNFAEEVSWGIVHFR